MYVLLIHNKMCACGAHKRECWRMLASVGELTGLRLRYSQIELTRVDDDIERMQEGGSKPEHLRHGEERR